MNTSRHDGLTVRPTNQYADSTGRSVRLSTLPPTTPLCLPLSFRRSLSANKIIQASLHKKTWDRQSSPDPARLESGNLHSEDEVAYTSTDTNSVFELPLPRVGRHDTTPQQRCELEKRELANEHHEHHKTRTSQVSLMSTTTNASAAKIRLCQ